MFDRPGGISVDKRGHQGQI